MPWVVFYNSHSEINITLKTTRAQKNILIKNHRLVLTLSRP